MFADTRRRGKEGARAASTKVPIEMSFLSPAKRESSRTEEGSGMFIEIPFFLLPLRSCPVDHATPPSLHVLWPSLLLQSFEFFFQSASETATHISSLWRSLIRRAPKQHSSDGSTSRHWRPLSEICQFCKNRMYFVLHFNGLKCIRSNTFPSV